MATFHPFTNLPPELRHQIWIEALSDCIPPTAFLYKTNCWELSVVRDPNKEELKFRHKQLDPIPLKVPLLSVCHEVRGIALAWLHKRKDVRIQGEEQLTTGKNDKLVISKAFDPSRDVLYIPPKVFWNFYDDSSDLVFELADEGWLVEGKNPVKKLAIHTDSLDLIDEDMWDLYLTIERWYRSVNCIFMVVNLDMDPQFCSQGKTLQDRWTFDMLPAARDCQEPSQKNFYKKAKKLQIEMEDWIDSEKPRRRISVRPVEMRKL